jgi:hypothetical protein
MIDRRRSRRDAVALLMKMMTAVTLAGTASAQTQPDKPQPMIKSLNIACETGNDDVRPASQVIAHIDYQGANGNDLSVSAPLNNGAGWPNGHKASVAVDMPAGVRMGSIRRFAIEFNSGQSNIFDTGDNWSLQAVTVMALIEEGTEKKEVGLIQQAGNPLHRFKSDNNTFWRTAL